MPSTTSDYSYVPVKLQHGTTVTSDPSTAAAHSGSDTEPGYQYISSGPSAPIMNDPWQVSAEPMYESLSNPVYESLSTSPPVGSWEASAGADPTIAAALGDRQGDKDPVYESLPEGTEYNFLSTSFGVEALSPISSEKDGPEKAGPGAEGAEKGPVSEHPDGTGKGTKRILALQEEAVENPYSSGP